MSATFRPARIWYQSFVHPIEQAPYIERLQAYLNEAAGPDIKFEVHGLDPPEAPAPVQRISAGLQPFERRRLMLRQLARFDCLLDFQGHKGESA